MTKRDRADLFAETAERRDLSEAVVEKDFWVCWTLKQLFAIDALRDRLLFKGGTSLSKINHAINRFSEDIDLAVDYVALGCLFSVGPAMLGSENGKKLVQRIPPERILTESDGPFAQLNDQPVMPWHVERAIHELSAIWLLPPLKVAKTIDNNLRSLLDRHA